MQFSAFHYACVVDRGEGADMIGYLYQVAPDLQATMNYHAMELVDPGFSTLKRQFTHHVQHQAISEDHLRMGRFAPSWDECMEKQKKTG